MMRNKILAAIALAVLGLVAVHHLYGLPDEKPAANADKKPVEDPSNIPTSR
jgi:hypothetical protein